MKHHVYLRAYMAGVALPTVLVVLALVGFVAWRAGSSQAFPVERGLVFPLAIVPGLWGLWNMLYVLVRRHWRLPLGVHGALIPLLVGPLALWNAARLGFETPGALVAVFPVAVAAAMASYYLVWKYVVGYFNRVLEIA
jgi:hypothetical protein